MHQRSLQAGNFGHQAPRLGRIDWAVCLAYRMESDRVRPRAPSMIEKASGPLLHPIPRQAKMTQIDLT